MSLTPTLFLVALGLLFAIASLVPPWPSHPLLAVAVILTTVGILAGAAVH